MKVEVFKSFPWNIGYRKCDRCGHNSKFLGGWRILSGKWEKFACKRCTISSEDARWWYFENFPTPKPKAPPPPNPPIWEIKTSKTPRAICDECNALKELHVYRDCRIFKEYGEALCKFARLEKRQSPRRSGVPDIVKYGQKAGKEIRELCEEINSKVERNYQILLKLSEEEKDE